MVKIILTPTSSYAACVTVTGPSTAYFTLNLSASGVQQRGLAVAEISDTNTAGGYGRATTCTLGGITPDAGAVTFVATYTTVKGSTGSLPVYCVTVSRTFTCSPTSTASVAAVD